MNNNTDFSTASPMITSPTITSPTSAPYTDDDVLSELWQIKDARAAQYGNATTMLAALNAKYPQPASWSDFMGILKDSPNFQGNPVDIQRQMRDEWHSPAR